MTRSKKPLAHSRRPTPRGGALAALLAVVVLVACAMGVPRSVQAADETRRKAALSLLEVAKFYYQSGKFLKAAKGFHEAYAIDPRPEFLFNAARAEHLGMDLENSAKHYRECVALKSRNSKLNKRSKFYLVQVEATLAALKKARAEGAQAAKAAVAAHDDVRRNSGSTEAKLEGVDKIKAADPSQSGKTSAAKAAKGAAAAGKRPDGTGDPNSAPPGDDTKKAAARKNVKLSAKDPAAAPSSMSEPAAWRAPVGWGAVGLGSVGFALAIKVMIDVSSEQADLDELVATTDETGAIVGIGAVAYRTRQNELNTQSATAVAGMTVSAALLGVGAFVLLTAPEAESVALTPWTVGRGLNVRLRF